MKGLRVLLLPCMDEILVYHYTLPLVFHQVSLTVHITHLQHILLSGERHYESNLRDIISPKIQLIGLGLTKRY